MESNERKDEEIDINKLELKKGKGRKRTRNRGIRETEELKRRRKKWS